MAQTNRHFVAQPDRIHVLSMTGEVQNAGIRALHDGADIGKRAATSVRGRILSRFRDRSSSNRTCRKSAARCNHRVLPASPGLSSLTGWTNRVVGQAERMIAAGVEQHVCVGGDDLEE